MINKFYTYIKKTFNFYRIKVLKSRGLKMGVNTTLCAPIQIAFAHKLIIADNVYIGPNASIHALGGVSIGSGTIIGPNLVIHSANHNYKLAKAIPYDETFDLRKVTIEENVWIGGNVIIVPGAHIGEGAIIGAGSVVAGNIPPLSIVIGNPAKVIKYRDREHYNKLKQNNQIYYKLKSEGVLTPNYNI